jgi:DNA-binding NarL/FixJ family response regulator
MLAQGNPHRTSDRVDGRRLRVLIVDDHEVYRIGLRAVLADEGFEVADSDGGEAALHQLRSFPADVVIVDPGTGMLSGIELASRVADDAPAASVLILTLSADEALVLDTLRAGGAGFLFKDANLEEIVAAVRAVAAGEAAIDRRVVGMLVTLLRAAAPGPGPASSTSPGGIN